jgi:uncharacterized membrane protein YfcA
MLVIVFIVTLLSGIVAVTGGNGLILMPALMILDFNIKEVLILVRTSAVIFVAFNLIALIKDKKMLSFNKKDFFITALSSVTIIFSASLLTKLNDVLLMSIIALILVGLFLLVIFKPRGKILDQFFIIVLPFFAGICGSAVGGAGLIITILYTLLGADPKEAVKKRILPSLIIQIIAFTSLMNQGIKIDYRTLTIVIVATAIAGYLNMKIFMKLTPKAGKILFYASFIFSIFNLLEDAVENILHLKNMDWIDLIK